MSKTSNYRLPSGSFGISGGPVATYGNGSTNYKLSDAQQKAYDYAQNSFADNLPAINVFSPETVSTIKEQVHAYKNNAIKELEDIYSPMLRETRNDAAKRFGNLDNSVFLQNLDTVEAKRAKAVNQLAQDIVSKQNELVNDELQNRYDYLSFLDNYQNNVFSNALNAANVAINGAKSYNNAYNTNNNASLKQLANVVNQAGLIAGLFV